MSPGGTLPTSRSSSNLSALSASGTRSAGLRMAIQQIRFVDHEQLLKMLNHLLRLAPGLASPDVLTYLKAAGVDIDAIISNMAKQFKSPTIQRSGGVASAAWPSSASPHRSLPNPIRLALPSNPSWESVQSTTTTSQSVVIDSAIIHNPALLAMRDEVMSNTTHDDDEEDASSTFKDLKAVEELN